MELTPLRKSDFEIGKPLPWPVYDQKKKLLLQEGFVLQTQNQLDTLFANGLFRNPAWVRPKASGEIFGKEAPRETEKHSAPKAFTAINMRIGEGLQLQLQSDQTRYAVKFIGYLEKKSLLVTAPAHNNSIILMREGQGVVLRCFSGKNAFAFNSSVLRSCSSPFPYLHLAYPASVQGMEVRKAARIKTNIIASAWKETNEAAKMSCVIEDLSFNGAALNSTAELGRAGDSLKLYFRIAVQGETMYVSPKIAIRAVRNDAAGSDNRFFYGVEFQDFDLSERLALQNFVYQSIVEL